MDCAKISTLDPWTLYFNPTSNHSKYEHLLQIFSVFKHSVARPCPTARAIGDDRDFTPLYGESLFDTPIVPQHPAGTPPETADSWPARLLQAVEQRKAKEAHAIAEENWLQCLHKPQLMAKVAEVLWASNEDHLLKQLTEKIPTRLQTKHVDVYCYFARLCAFRGKFYEARKIFQFWLVKFAPFTTCHSILNYEWIKIEMSLLNLQQVQEKIGQAYFHRNNLALLKGRLRILQVYLNPSHQPIDIKKEIDRALEDSGSLSNAVVYLDDFTSVILAQGRYEEGLDAYQHMIERILPLIKNKGRNVVQKKLFLGVAKCHLLLKNANEAKQFMEQALQVNDPRAKNDQPILLACCYEMTGQVAEAQKELIARIFNPDNGNNILPTSKSFCTAYLRLCYRQGIHAAPLHCEQAMLSVFPELAFYFIKIRATQGEFPYALLEKYRPANVRVGQFYCEEARLYLNPCKSCFNPSKAKILLEQALLLTPQCGDIWLELARVHMIVNGVDTDLTELTHRVVGVAPEHGELWTFLTNWQNFSPLLMFQSALQTLRQEMRQVMPIYQQALAKQLPPISLTQDFFAGSPAFCKAIQSPPGITESFNRYQHLGMIQGPWKKKYSL